METDIICITEHIEIHPSRGRWAVVRDGSAYGTYESLDFAREVADGLAADWTETDDPTPTEHREHVATGWWERGDDRIELQEADGKVGYYRYAIDAPDSGTMYDTLEAAQAR